MRASGRRAGRAPPAACAVLLVVVQGAAAGWFQATQPSTASAPSAGFLALMHAGQARLAKWDAAGAVQAFQAALAADPASAAARINLGLALLRAERPREAADAFAAALKDAPDAAPLLYLYGLSLLQDDRAAEAVRPLGRAAELEPREPSVLFQYGVALQQAGRADEAAGVLRRVIATDRFHVTAPFRLAQLERRAGRAAEAEHLTALSQRNRAVLGPDAAQREQQGVNRFTRPLHVVADFQPPPADPPLRFAPVELEADPSAPAGMRGAVAVPGDAAGGAPLVLGVSDGFHVGYLTANRWAVRPDAVRSRRTFLPAAAAVADYDNDGLEDALFVADNGCALFRRTARERFDDVTDAAGLGEVAGRDAQWVDLDHDGDVDLLLVSAAGELRFLRNRGNGTFADETALLDLPDAVRGAAARLRNVARGELNDDDGIDLAAAGEAAGLLIFNAGRDSFASTSLPPRSIAGAASAVVIDDVNNDGHLDAALAEFDPRARVAVIRFSDAAIRSIDAGEEAIDWLGLVDADNDGFLDVFALSRQGLRAWRNRGAAGWGEVTAALGLADVREVATSTPASWPANAPRSRWAHPADFDADGDLDLLLTRRDGPPHLLRNDGGNALHAARIALQGTKSNRSGVGARVTLRAGPASITRQAGSAVLQVGIGSTARLDAVEIVWTNGATDAVTDVDPWQLISLIEPTIIQGSCPYLYVLGPQGFRFVTDILGNSPLGLSIARRRHLPADTDELVWLGSEQDVALQPAADGRPAYVVEITDELREVLYLDHARLIVADHPPATEVHPTDKLRPPPFPPSVLWSIVDLRPPRRAVDARGGDVTDLIAAADARRLAPGARRAPQLRGLAEPQQVELHFDRLDPADCVLALTGWLRYGDASVNLAASQNPDLPNPFPTLSARTPDGRWHAVDVVVGAPAGKSKTILVDLSGRLPRETDALRLSWSLELFWDRITVGRRGPPLHTVPVDAHNAVLRRRGVSVLRPTDDSGPLVPAYTELLPRLPWRTIPAGWCSRFGEVTPLLHAVDDRYVVMNCGDALRIEFPADVVPPIAPGLRRDFFLYLDGWDKDSDPNVTSGNTVDPLPVHGQDDQAYGTCTSAPADDDWLAEYNTRRVGEAAETSVDGLLRSHSP